MSFNLQKILASKQAHRQRLAALPIGEKLRMLDALRERTLAIRGSALATMKFPIPSNSTGLSRPIQDRDHP